MKFPEIYNDPEYIISDDRRQVIVFKDKRESRIYRVQNPSRKKVTAYRVDRGIIDSLLTEKCDYAFYTEDDTLCLIELKGSDVLQAIKQISNSIDILLRPVRDIPDHVNARIILSKYNVPSAYKAEEIRLHKKLKSFGGELVTKVKLLEEKL